MPAKEWSTIRVPRPVFESANRRRRAVGMTWADVVDAGAPDLARLEAGLREAVREEVRAVLDEVDTDALVEDEPEPLEPLIPPDGDTCLICGEVFDATGRAIIHALEEHPDEVNERHAEADRRRRANGEVADVEWASSQNGDDPMTVNPDGPVSYFDAPMERVGSPWGNGTTATRECDIGGPECMGTMSKNYARVFARAEDGRLACPNCLSRSGRYSADHAERGDGRTSPSDLTGQANPNAAVPHVEPDAEG